MSIFVVGNTVRHKRCYWGEPAYYISAILPSGARGIPTGSKHGKAWDGFSACVIYPGSEPNYKICPMYMRAWLWLLGTISELGKK